MKMEIRDSQALEAAASSYLKAWDKLKAQIEAAAGMRIPVKVISDSGGKVITSRSEATRELDYESR